MKKVFLTGAGGFVGAHFIERLKNDYEIIALRFEGADEVVEGARNRQGDITNKESLANILGEEKPEVILHLAARPVVWDTNLEEIFKVNLFGTVNLYEAVLEVKESDNNYNPKILFISSAEVYGKTNNPGNVDENSAINPVNLYGVSKVSADRLSYAYTQVKHLNIIIVRPFNHTGPGQRTGFFVPDMASQIAEIEKNEAGGELMVGNLESTRDLLDVRDVVEAYKAIIEADFESGETVNICSGQGIKMRDLLNKLLAMSDKKIEIKQDEKRMRPSDIPLYVGNSQKLREKTGWSPKYTVDETLRDVLTYWRVKLSNGQFNG